MSTNTANQTGHIHSSKQLTTPRHRLVIAVSASLALLGTPVTLYAADEILLVQALVGTAADESDKNEATLTISGGELALKANAASSADSATAVQTTDTSVAARGLGGVGVDGSNRLDLTVDSDAEGAANTIYLTQIGGSWLAMTLKGNDNQVTISDLAGMGTLNGEVATDTIDVVGDSNFLRIDSFAKGNILEQLDIDIGADGAPSNDNLVVLEYSDFASIVAKIDTSSAAEIRVYQSNLAGLGAFDGEGRLMLAAGQIATTESLTYTNTAKVNVLNNSSTATNTIDQWGGNNSATINTIGSGNDLLITQDNISSTQTATLEADGNDNDMTLIQYSPDGAANASQSAIITAEGNSNTIWAEQEVQQVTVDPGSQATVENSIDLEVFDNDNNITIKQLVYSSVANNQGNRIVGVNDTLVGGIASDSAIIQGQASWYDLSQVIVTDGKATNTLALSIDGSGNNINQANVSGDITAVTNTTLKQEINTGNSNDGGVGAVFSNTAILSIQNDSDADNEAQLFLQQSIVSDNVDAAAVSASNNASITVLDTGDTAVGNQINARQINYGGSPLNLSLLVDGDGNNVSVRQENASDLTTTADNNLTIKLIDDDATLDVAVIGAGTNTLTIAGDANTIKLSNDLAGSGIYDASSTVEIYGDNNGLYAYDFKTLKVVIGDSTAEDGVLAAGNNNTVSTEGDANIYIGSDTTQTVSSVDYSVQNIVEYQNGYSSYFDSNNANVSVIGSYNKLALSDTNLALAEGHAGGAYTVSVTGSSNEFGGTISAVGQDVTDRFSTVDVATTSISVIGGSNTIVNTLAETTEAISNLEELEIDVTGSGNTLAVHGAALGASFMLGLYGDNNVLDFDLGGAASLADLGIYIEGSNNMLDFNLGGGDLSYELVGGGFEGSLETIGSGYYQTLSVLGIGSISIESSMGTMNLSANCGAGGCPSGTYY